MLLPLLIEKLRYKRSMRSLLSLLLSTLAPALGLTWVLAPDTFPSLRSMGDNNGNNPVPPAPPAADEGPPPAAAEAPAPPAHDDEAPADNAVGGVDMDGVGDHRDAAAQPNSLAEAGQYSMQLVCGRDDPSAETGAGSNSFGGLDTRIVAYVDRETLVQQKRQRSPNACESGADTVQSCAPRNDEDDDEDDDDDGDGDGDGDGGNEEEYMTWRDVCGEDAACNEYEDESDFHGEGLEYSKEDGKWSSQAVRCAQKGKRLAVEVEGNCASWDANGYRCFLFRIYFLLLSLSLHHLNFFPFVMFSN